MINRRNRGKRLKMKYNYVVFDDSGEYYKTAISDLFGVSGILVLDWRYGCVNKTTLPLYRLHTAERIDKFVKLPWKEVWNKTYYQDAFNNNKPTCFVFTTISNYMWESNLFADLKNLKPDNKLVYIYRDRTDVSMRRSTLNTIENIRVNFDLILTYDKITADKYGFTWFPSFCSYIPITKDNKYPLSDVFFAGVSKGRLEILLDVYKKLSSKGVKCEINIMGVPKSERKEHEGINYIDKPMSYKEMLYKSINSRCILEISQKNVRGFTSRFFEAITYNKKLLTNNSIVKETNFYDKSCIQVFEDANEINCDFILDDYVECNYNYAGEYSPLRMIELIEKKIKEK